MKTIAVVTATRAEYGLLRRTIEALREEPSFDVRLIVTGTHLSPAFGETWKQIQKDGLKIDEKIDYLSEDRSPAGIAREAACCAQLFADAFEAMQPQLLLVLGDRYELLPICSTALIMGIPIAHIAGGEHTEGAIDDAVRNAVTMMATVHFPNSEEAAREVIRLRGSDQNVFEVGEPGAEHILKAVHPSREELAARLGLDPSKPWVMATLHPETRESEDYNLNMAQSMLDALRTLQGHEIVLSKANADFCGEKMNKLYEAARGVHLFSSLGQEVFLGMMKEDPTAELPKNFGDPLLCAGYGMKYGASTDFEYSTLVLPTGVTITETESNGSKQTEAKLFTEPQKAGEPFTVSFLLRNNGAAGVETVNVYDNDTLVAQKVVAINDNGWRVVQIDVTVDGAGEHILTVGTLSGTVTVE